MLILGIDPGLVQTGFGLINVNNNINKIIDYGVIAPNSKDNLSTRLYTIYDDLLWVIDKYQRNIMAIEEVFYGKNVKSALLLGHARGASMICAAKYNMPVFEYSARKVKQSLSGNGNAQKEQVQYMVKAILKMQDFPKPLDPVNNITLGNLFFL